jgi:fluoride exporter
VSQVALIALAGAVGTLCRYGLGAWTYRLWGGSFPWGTLVSNVLGCLVIGAFFGAWRTAEAVPDTWRLPIAVGFCGGFTTMSSFAYETVRYAQQGVWRTAVLNVVASITLSLLAVALGLATGRALFARP